MALLIDRCVFRDNRGQVTDLHFSFQAENGVNNLSASQQQLSSVLGFSLPGLLLLSGSSSGNSFVFSENPESAHFIVFDLSFFGLARFKVAFILSASSFREKRIFLSRTIAREMHRYRKLKRTSRINKSKSLSDFLCFLQPLDPAYLLLNCLDPANQKNLGEVKNLMTQVTYAPVLIAEMKEVSLVLSKPADAKLTKPVPFDHISICSLDGPLPVNDLV